MSIANTILSTESVTDEIYESLPTEKSSTILLNLLLETLQDIANYLDPASTACFVFSSNIIHSALGTQSWDIINKDSTYQ